MKLGLKWAGTALLGLVAVSANAQAVDAVQLRNWAAACANCHGTNGVAQPGMESLAGQKQDEMAKKLLDFKAGRKPATVMHQLTKGYSDDELQQLAGYFAALKK